MAQFRSALTQSDLISASTVSVVVGQYNKLGERIIQAGELMTLGFGSQAGQESAQGRLFIDIRDNGVSPGAQLKGTVRLQVYSPQNRPLRILGEWRTETVSSGSGNRTLQVPFPVGHVWASEDKKIVLEFLPDAAGTVGKTNTVITIDNTVEQV